MNVELLEQKCTCSPLMSSMNELCPNCEAQYSQWRINQEEEGWSQSKAMPIQMWNEALRAAFVAAAMLMLMLLSSAPKLDAAHLFSEKELQGQQQTATAKHKKNSAAPPRHIRRRR